MKNRKPRAAFLFECRRCGGQYPVSKKTAEQFLSKELRKKLKHALGHEGAVGAVLTFKNGCPQCVPENLEAVVELSVLEPKQTH